MKNIILICASGMSTSILVKKMREEADKAGKEVTIEAMPESSLAHYRGNLDCILLGPQIGYLEEDIKKQYTEVPVEVIDSVNYGMVDGKKVLKRAFELMENSD